MPKNGHLKWNVVYQPGKLTAVGYKNGKRILVKTIETTQAPYQIVMKTERSSIQADGRDVAVITIEIQDRKGRMVPDACQLLNLSLSGDGRILGVGNGDPAYLGSDHPNEMDCHNFQIPAFNGLAQVILQSSHQPTSLQLTCKAARLKGSRITIVAK